MRQNTEQRTVPEKSQDQSESFFTYHHDLCRSQSVKRREASLQWIANAETLVCTDNDLEKLIVQCYDVGK
jgi:hypothetical protein